MLPISLELTNHSTRAIPTAQFPQSNLSSCARNSVYVFLLAETVKQRRELTTSPRTGLPPQHVRNVRLPSLHRHKHSPKIRTQEAHRGSQALSQYRQKRYEVQRHDAEDEGRPGKLSRRGRRATLHCGAGGVVAADAGLFCLLERFWHNWVGLVMVLMIYINDFL